MDVVCKSADNSVDHYAKNQRQNLVKNEPKGYRGDHKENGKPPQSSYLRVHGTVDKSYLQKYGQAVLSQQPRDKLPLVSITNN